MKIAVLFFLGFMSLMLSAQTVKLTISGLRNNSGSVTLGFYVTDDSFDKELPLFSKIESKATTVNGVLTIIFKDIKPGIYGIVLLDDENDNKKMDYGWLLPKEGYGFSNYYHTGMTKPHLSKFSFVLKNDPVAVNIKVKYF